VLQAWGFSDKGPVRPTNQDRIAIDQDLRLCVIADGMGGHHAGEIAAHTAVDAVIEVVRDRQQTRPPDAAAASGSSLGWPFGVDPSLSEAGNLLRTAIHVANMQVLEEAGRSRAYGGMGTTIVAVLVADGRWSVGHVGDSRLYRLAGGRLRQLTGDDSWMASVMANDPHANVTLLEHHPMRHALTNVVGCGPRTEVHVVEEALAYGDRLLLTTDGVHGVIDERRLERLVADPDDLPGAASGIVRAAIARGSRDNCTAIVAQYLPG
jgi:serine/threonine protein phosphatase PrpC